MKHAIKLTTVLTVLLALALSGCAATVTTTVGPLGMAAVTKEDCKDGGWQRLTTRQGTPFNNQGECVSYFAAD